MAAKYINWLASYPKSGNTWVRAFLEHYEKGKIEINKMDTVVGDERIAFFQSVSAQPYYKFDLYEWALVRPAALQMYLHMYCKKDKLILKTHNAHAVIGGIPLFPPLISGPSVYLVRNPLEVIPSFARHTGKDVDEMVSAVQETGHSFSANVQKQSMIGFLCSWEAHVRSWTKAPDTIVIRFEDLKENPEYWFTQILKQYGYEVNKTKILEAIDASSIDKLREQEKASGFDEAGRNDSFFGGTKEKLNPSQVSEVIEAFGDVMDEYGYFDRELKHGSHY